MPALGDTANLAYTVDPGKVICIILGGGGGKGLFPLTRDRAIPAVPLAGNYRLVDVPISNCINSGLRQIYVLTQFNSASLHRHVSEAYKFDQFSEAFVEIRAAQQTFTDNTWYQGTADAVRKNLEHFLARDFEYALVLCADQLYRQDFRALLEQHRQSGADITVASVPVGREKSSSCGILQVDGECRIQQFVEKPTEPAALDPLRLSSQWTSRLHLAADGEMFLASMGTYIFNRDALRKLLDNAHPDFGRDILPHAVRTHRVFAHVFDGYWGDLGTVRSFFDANLELVRELPRFNFFDVSAPIFSQPIYLPGAKVNGAHIDHALLAAGCVISHANISESVIGLRSVVSAGASLTRVVSLGCDYYESAESIRIHERDGIPRIGIGRNTRIENAIVDRNARIGDDVVITPHGKPAHVDSESYFIRDGVVVIPRNGVIPHGTII